MSRHRIPLVLVACLAGLTACGSSASHNDADVMFAQMMIPHHEQALELADLALNPASASSEGVRELAAQMKNTQDPEITFMKDWLSSRDEPLVADDGVDHSSMMSGMLTLEDLDALRGLAGAEFDTAWIAAVIAHHEGAIDMAETVRRDGQDSAIEELAAAIIAAQGAEIEQLRSL